MEIYRVADTFHITGRGIVYTLRIDSKDVISKGDFLYDLRVHRFKVKGIEMIRQAAAWKDDDTQLLGVMLERLDNAEVYGRLLLSEPAKLHFLFCSHPLYLKRVDEDYAEEYQAAGLKYARALFSYEDLQDGKLSLYGEKIAGLTIYRGWMMKPELYRVFYELLEEQGIILINSPEEYEHYHVLPNWYKEFENDTAQSWWTASDSIKEATRLADGLEGPYIVKDYVKSRKHEWYDACFIANAADQHNTEKIITNFIIRQGDDLAGGVVLRQFIPLKPIGFHEVSGMPMAEEYRVFVFAGKILAIDDYWTSTHQVHLTEEEYQWIEKLAQTLKSNFVAMDLARKADGNLMIMELGDGQVSGLQQIEAAGFYQALEESDINNL